MITPNLRAEGKRISYKYENLRLKRIVYPQLATVNDNPRNVFYQYGAPTDADPSVRGRLKTVLVGPGASDTVPPPASVYTAAYRYDPLGNVSEETKIIATTALQEALAREAAARGIKLVKTWQRPMRKLKVRHARLRHQRKRREANRTLARMRTLQRRLIRKLEAQPGELDQGMKDLIARARKLHEQSRGKLPFPERTFSVHAPEVECIPQGDLSLRSGVPQGDLSLRSGVGKGKPHKPWEFGVKVGLAVTAKQTFAVACDSYAGRPYDGATLKPTLAQAERVSGVKPVLAIGDGTYKGADHHPAGIGVLVAGARKLAGKLKAWMRRRSSIEPAFGHMKNRLGMDRNRLAGARGDRFNAILSAAAWNLLKIARHLVRRLARLWRLVARLWRLLTLWIAAQALLMRLRLEIRRIDLPLAA